MLNENFQKFRKLGPQGKLHNITTFFVRTPQRLQRFKDLANGLTPKQDQETRWNAWEIAMDWALERIRVPLITFVSMESELSSDALTAEDWIILAQMRDFLKNFKEVTKLAEGREATINEVLPMLDFLLDQYSIELTKYPPGSHMYASLTAGQLKLQKYWNLAVAKAPVYIAAIVLDPSQKWFYFSRGRWTTRELTQAKYSFGEMWSKYSHQSIDPTDTTSITLEATANTSTFLQWKAHMTPIALPIDELEQYLVEPRVQSSGDVIAWWRTQRDRLPNLTKMAMNVFAIPPMSSEPERVFSGAKNTISDERARLKPEIIEALECCKGMLRMKLFTDEAVTATLSRELDDLEVNTKD